MRIQPGFARRNVRVGFSAFLAVDAVCDGSRELSITFFSYSLASEDYRSSKTKEYSRKKELDKLSTFFAKERYRTLRRVPAEL